MHAMMTTDLSHRNSIRNQVGATAIEFAIVSFLLFTLLFGIVELGRLFYLWNTVQEVTRHAARLAVVSWPVGTTELNIIKEQALFGGSALPAGGEVNTDNDDTLSIKYYKSYSDALAGTNAVQPTGTAEENLSECVKSPPSCINFVKATISGVQYVPMISLFQGVQFGPIALPDLRINVPPSTVIMPAESLGL